MAFKPDISLLAIKSLSGGGNGVRGENCTIRSITETTDPETGRTGHIVTFAWSTDDGDARTSTMTVWDGENGENGESPTVGISNIAGGHRITFTDVDGDHPVDVMDGQSVTITTETIDGGNVVTIESASGTQYITIMNGTDGADGTSFVVNGQYATEAELRAAHPTGTKGDAYSVGTASNSTIFLWDIDAEDWANIGSIKGEKGDNGFTPVVSVGRTATNDGVVIEVTNQSGTQSAVVNDGEAGQAGADGVGVPAGGTVGQILTKKTNDDYDAEWGDAPDVSRFITNTVDNLTNYYKKTETYTQAEINTLVNTAASGGFEVVTALPTTDISTKKIYLLAKSPAGESGDLYDEYIYVNSAWEHIGSTSIDLTAYQTKNLSAAITVGGTAQTTVEGALTAINAALANYLTTSAFNTQIANYYTKTQMNAITGDLDDLTTTEKGSLVGAINEAAASGGSGVPDGGTTGQVLTKKSNTDGDADWENASSGLPDGGDEGQVLAKLSDADGDAGWVNQASIDTMPTMIGATPYADGAKGLVPKPVISDRAKALFGDGKYHNIYTEAAGSTIMVVTGESALYGQTVTMTDGRTTMTATMGSDGECFFTDVQMYGGVSLTCPDADGNVARASLNLTYFGTYTATLTLNFATIHVTTSDKDLYGRTVEYYLNGNLIGSVAFNTSGVTDIYVDVLGTYTLKATDGDRHAHSVVDVSALKQTFNSDMFLYYCYAFVIDDADSNPATRVTAYQSEFGCDNQEFAPAKMDYSTGAFDYGDWTGKEFFFPRPCLLGFDGIVQKYLDKNNYAMDVDGNAVDISSASVSGNVMIEFPTIYFKRWQENNKNYCVISDKQIDSDFHAYAHHNKNGQVLPYIYLAAYDGSYDGTRLRSLSGKSAHNKNALTNGYIMSNTTRQQEVSYAQANNANIASGHEGYHTWHKADWDMVRDLLTLIGMSTDYQTTFGRGKDSGFVSTTSTGQVATGSMNTKGMFWGENAGSAGVKVFGIENFWANIWKAVAGWIKANGEQKTKMTYGKEDGSTVDGFNFDGSGYVTVSGATPSGTSGGYISAVKMGAYGLIPYTANGSDATYYCDGLWFNNSQVDYALVGGGSNNGLRCGAAYSYLSSAASHASWDVGAALSCK